MKKLIELKEKLCDELKTYADMSINTANVDAVDKLAHAIKNLDKIIDNYDEYSNRGSYRMSRREWHDDMSHARRRDAMGRYANEGYSRTHDNMIEELHELMERAPAETKGEFKRFIERVEMM